MEKSQKLQVQESSQSCSPILTLGGRVSQGTTLTVLAVAGVGAGLVLGWDSLVALGLSSIIIILLPCAAMCALGMCMGRKAEGDKPAVGTPSATPGSDAKAVKAEPVSEPNTSTPGNRA